MILPTWALDREIERGQAQGYGGQGPLEKGPRDVGKSPLL